MDMNPLFLIDFYKACHYDQYPKNLTKLVSYLTPRMSRIEGEDKLIMFGLQAFIKEYLIDGFNKYFFSRDKNEVVSEYKEILDATLGDGAYSIEKIAELHDLGYLPLEIRSIPEGMRVNVKVPMVEISNTHPRFVWLVNTIETMLSCSLWHTMISANVGHMYRQIVNEYYDMTVDDSVPVSTALGDFSMRGQESVESAIRSSAAFCLSFRNTATVGAAMWLKRYYGAHPEDKSQVVIRGAISTEHSVMCSNFAVDGDERTMVKRLLTEIYPHHSFSMVSDSYDYWNMVDVIIPSLKDEILNHDGKLLIRGDSGDPVEIVTQTVFHLWNTFGGTVNQKGYRVLDPHIGVIYGDSITPQRCEKIYDILMKNGFACNNVVLGVGSFSMQCLEQFDEDGTVHYAPYTRDTFGIAVKSTYAEDDTGNSIEIFKNPKTDSGHFKKSQRGCCYVIYDEHYNKFSYIDGLTMKEREKLELEFESDNMLVPVFSDGEMLHEQSLDDVRENLCMDSFEDDNAWALGRW